MANPIGKSITEEMRKSGAPPQKKEPQDYESDEMLFKAHVLDPQDPVYTVTESWVDPSKAVDDPDRTIDVLAKKWQFVSTHALGNFTSREVRGINSLMVVAEICERNGYPNVAAELSRRYVRHVVTSQCIEFKLGTMLLTNLNALYRKEEFPASPEEAATEGKNIGKGFGAIFDKIKALDRQNKPDEAKKMM